MQAALKRGYEIIESIQWPGKHYRKDIAHRALKTLSTNSSKSRGTGSGMTYAEAGVSIPAGNELVERIRAHVKSTKRPGASSDIGGFGGVFDLAEAGYDKAPLLVTGTDGVGTKLQIAQAMDIHSTIGVDLVAMCANDIVVQGAEPLFMTDVFSCSRLDVGIAESVVSGISQGCREARCALVGGETAEMADFFVPDRYDIVGACTGAAPRERGLLPNKAAMSENDTLLGLASSGCHSNGFSLIRKVLKHAQLEYPDLAPWDDEEHKHSVGQSLLTPTRIYVKALLRLVEANLVKGMAHITGGGLWENVPRMLPNELAASLDAQQWECPSVLKWLKRSGGVDDVEFARTFNAGLGMVLVVTESHVQEAMSLLEDSGERVWKVGQLTKREGEGCIVRNMEVWNR